MTLLHRDCVVVEKVPVRYEPAAWVFLAQADGQETYDPRSKAIAFRWDENQNDAKPAAQSDEPLLRSSKKSCLVTLL